MLKHFFDVQNITGIELGEIEFYPAKADCAAFWTRRITLRGHRDSKTEIVLYSNVGDMALMTADEKDLCGLEYIVSPGEPSGVARIATIHDGDADDSADPLPDRTTPMADESIPW